MSYFHFQIRLKESPIPKPVVYGIWHLKSRILNEYVAYLLENSIDCEAIRVDELTGMKYTFFRDPDYLPIELYENNY